MSELVPAASLLLLRPAPAAPGGFEVACAHRARALRLQGDEWTLPGRPAGAESPRAAALRAAAELGVVLPGGEAGLLPCGRWRAAPFAPARADSALFLGLAPTGATLAPAGEVDRAEWLAAGALPARWRADEARLGPATRIPLETLAARPAFQPGAGWLEAAAAALAAVCPPEGEWEEGVDLHPGVRVVPLRTPTLPPATHTNCLVVGDGSELVVIDPASPWEDQQARLDALLARLEAGGQRVRELLLTHHHPDHTSGAAHLAARLRVPVSAHRRTAELLRGKVGVTHPIDDGHVIELAGDRPGARPRRLRAHLLEGHADGHLVFHEEVTGGVIAGDMVAGTGTILIDPPEGKMALYLRSLERLAGLHAPLLYPAHGPPIGDPARLVGDYVAHRLMREGKVLRAVQAGAGPIDELVPRAYDDTPPLLWPLAARSLLAHLEKLAEDGRVECAGEVWRALPA